MKDYRIAIAAIAGVVIMECVALIMGVNGVLLAGAVGTVSGVGGLLTDVKKILRRGQNAID